MRKTVVQLVCDGCGAELVEGPGTSKVHVDTNGSEHTSSLDLCPECTGKLPEGKKRKRPEKKAEATPAK